MLRKRPAKTHLHRGRWRASGFTLIEIVVTVALLGVVLALLLVPVMSSLGYFRSATARADAQTAARLAVDAMARELTEAMYVQLDMYDNSMTAFIPPLRIDPSDPNSEIVTPPRPDWSRAVRYWRALRDPTMNYNPQAQLGPSNTYVLARTVIERLPDDPPDSFAPFATYDPWNRWNDAWELEQRAAGAEGVTNWSAINRMVHTDLDWRFEGDSFGRRNATLQPGFPYLWVQHQLASGDIGVAQAARLYRDHVVALTPNAADYDVSQLEFNPTVVAGEWLRPAQRAGSRDYSIYRARYPLWRLGASYTGWAQLSDEPLQPLGALLSNLTWARDPFLLIYRYEPGMAGYAYLLRAVGVFDPRTRTMKIIDIDTEMELYDTGSYPYRGPIASFAFGVDWIDGSLRCDFPPPGDDVSMENEEPLEFAGSELQSMPVMGGSRNVFFRPLMPAWEARTLGDTLSYLLNPDTIQVRVDTIGDGVPDRTLTQVYGVPRANSDEFQVGLDLPDDIADDPLKYGYLRLPELLAGGIDPMACWFFVDFRWRSNGVVPAGLTLADEKPDLISAYYRTASVLDIAMTVTRADPSARAGQRVAQSAHMTRRVKLRNLLREIRYEE